MLDDQRFDAVLCHGVLPYLEDPAPLISVLAALARPGGIVSVVAKNAQTLAMRPAMARDWDRALASFEATTEVNELGLDTRADTPEQLSALLARHGLKDPTWYGVRLFTEGWGRDHPRVEPKAAVLAAELEASRRDPYRQLSHLFHLIVTQPAHPG